MFTKSRCPQKTPTFSASCGGPTVTLAESCQYTEWLSTYSAPHPPEAVPALDSDVQQRTNSDQFSSTAVNTVLQTFYVDDCLKSMETEEEAVSLYKDFKAEGLKGGFKLMKWNRGGEGEEGIRTRPGSGLSSSSSRSSYRTEYLTD